MAKLKFLGLQYPIVKNTRGLMAQKSGVDQIKADLLQLLLTNPGERVMLPTYGTPLRSLIFEPSDEIIEMQAKQMISDSILAWEPRIVVTNIEVTTNIKENDLNSLGINENDGRILYIIIKFVDPENIQSVEELVLVRPMGG